MATNPGSRAASRGRTRRGGNQKNESPAVPKQRGDQSSPKKKVSLDREAGPAAGSVEVSKAGGPGEPRVDLSEREATFNGRERGPAHAIAKPVDGIAAIDVFMIDLDLKLLDPKVIGDEAAGSADAFYRQYVSDWLDRDPVLKKAEVRDTGGGLHVLLQLDEPVIVAPGQQRAWDGVARGLHGVLPGDPNLSGIIAMTRPVGALNTKYDPPRQVRLLREGQPVTQREVLDLVERMTRAPARVWMNVLHGGERATPCPLCRGEATSLGVAGNWQVQCYECGRKDAASLVYRFYTSEFLTDRKEVRHG
jgi:hypothetical protein